MRIFRCFTIDNVNVGLISSTPISNRAFFLGFPVDTLVVI